MIAGFFPFCKYFKLITNHLKSHFCIFLKETYVSFLF